VATPHESQVTRKWAASTSFRVTKSTVHTYGTFATKAGPGEDVRRCATPAAYAAFTAELVGLVGVVGVVVVVVVLEAAAGASVFGADVSVLVASLLELPESSLFFEEPCDE
jgi:hypothetical protein